jgi:hypothetical protein
MVQRRRGGSAAEGDDGGEFRSSAQVRTAFIEGSTFRAKAVQYAVVDGIAMFEGDIVLGTEDDVARRSEQLRGEMTGQVSLGVVITGAQFRWPNCRVPYTIDASLPNQARVTDAINHWQTNTSFQFVARTTEGDYVTFRPSSGCSSSVGKRGGQQFVNLASGCTTGNVIHEIGHVVGMWHEQSREDRDAFVTINWDKIQPGYEHNFNQHISDGDDVGPYDYGSIMHYPRTAFSVDGSDTITPVDPAANIGQRTALSAGDIATANSMCAVKPVKEVVKEIPRDTIKEVIKDIRLDTRKELILDTRKELLKERPKEVAKDQIKEGALDPPWGRSPVINPPLSRPIVGPGGLLPFAVAAPHQAPAAGGAQQMEATIADLDAQLVALAEQILQAETTKEMLQAQYDETLNLLNQTLDAHDQASGR